MMKSIRMLLVVVGLIGTAAVAEGQCYQCRNLRPMPWYQGTCIEGQLGLCSSQCCGQPYGTQCTLPDNDLWYCFSYEGGLVANRYFTTARPTQNSAVALSKKFGTYEQYRRYAAKQHIPRRCPASV